MPVDIFQAAQDGQAHLLRSALEDDRSLATARDPNSDGRTALHIACAAGQVDAAQALLDAGADASAADNSGVTPLISAVSAGQTELVTALLGAGAEVTQANSKGLTPLHYAASRGNVALGRLLLDRGADVNALDSAKQLPLHRAASTGAVPFIKLLTDPRPPPAPKARLNTADRATNTPLHLAVESGHGEAAVALINAGADRQRQNSDSERPEELVGVHGEEARRVRRYIVDACGPLDS